MRQPVAPIDRLAELYRNAGWTVDREFLSYCIVKGILTPDAAVTDTGCDESAELVAEIALEAKRAWDAQRAEIRRLMGKREKKVASA